MEQTASLPPYLVVAISDWLRGWRDTIDTVIEAAPLS
jgi:hypothetical protein